MDLIAVLLTGLLAGGVSCAAVQGGLLTGLITRQAAHRHADPGNDDSRSMGRRAPVATAPEPRWSSRLGDDLIPVGGFLAGKLVSHALLGALLGALGSAVQLSASARTGLQIGAGLLIITFGLAQLGVPGFRRITVEVPASWQRLVRTRARSRAALAPALLGLATVLIPCGVTLSVEALALTSGSPIAGAATMAVFVLGTGPLFAVLGYAARKAATAWRGRLATLTGVAVLVTGLFTLNGGLELAGSPLAASRLFAASRPTQPIAGSGAPAGPAVTVANGAQTVMLTARSDGYSPDTLTIRAGLPTTLVIRSDNAQGCVRSFLIPDRDVDQVLPARGDTRIELGVLRPGQLDYSCGMGMYTGTLTIS